ncbi:unannotated protein [freshwater metagenome]|uniref:Unannotated protein n=1 Tax=freshwater metagenome TaxID=449393 RepID=A0A6J6IKD2_9ZZZZ
MFVIPRHVGDHRGEIAAGTVSGDGKTRGIDTEFLGIGGNPLGRGPGVIDRRGELRLRREPIVDGDNHALGLARDHPTAVIMRFEIPDDPATAVKERHDGEPGLGGRAIDADGDLATRAGDRAIGDARHRDRARRGARSHAGTEFLGRRAVEREADTCHEIDDDLSLRIEWHFSPWVFVPEGATVAQSRRSYDGAATPSSAGRRA